MESDLKRGDVSRKSFRLPAKSRQAPSPPKVAANVAESTAMAAAKTPIRLYNTTTTSSPRPSALVVPAAAVAAVGTHMKTFGPGECVRGETKQKPLKLADILQPDECQTAKYNNNQKFYVNAMDAPIPSGIETSLDVLKDLEKRINRIEMNEKLKQSINGRKATANGEATGELFQIKNQYTDRENLTRAGLDSSSTLSTGYEQSDENETKFFQRNSNERSSTGGTIALKSIIIDDHPLAQKSRNNYKQMQPGRQQLQKQQSLHQNNSTAAIDVNGREHITSFAGSKNASLTPLTSKKKESTIVVDKTKLATNTIADTSRRSTNTPKLSHSSSLKRETLRHHITPTTPTERTVKLNKKHSQVIWIRCMSFLSLASSKFIYTRIGSCYQCTKMI